MPLSSYSEVKGVKELSLPSVAKELRQMPWRAMLNFKSTKAVVLTPLTP